MPKETKRDNAEKSARCVGTSGFCRWVFRAARWANARLRSAPSPFDAANMKSAHGPAPENEQIHERNGIWVVTIGGVWHGDYTAREHAVAAVASSSPRSR